MSYILSIFFGVHDSNITISSKKEILLHLEAERVFRKKHLRIESSDKMIELIKIGLDYLKITIDDVSELLVAEYYNRFFIDNHEIEILGKKFKPIITSHHANHIGTASPSLFKDSIIICADGGSEDGTTKIYHKTINSIKLLEDMDATPATGKFYGTLTQMIISPDFASAHDTYPGKTMGIAPFGKKNLEIRKLIHKYSNEINKLQWIIGCNHLLKKFEISNIYSKPWNDARRCDLAFEGQSYWINFFIKSIKKYADISSNICIVGGCALNVVLNTKIMELGLFKNIYVPPIPGDSGQALGAILYHHPNIICNYPYLGRGFGEIDKHNTTIVSNVVNDLLNHKIIAWYQGRSEIGPRALGHRSIIGLPDSIKMRKRLSEIVKGREVYRPVSPIILEEYTNRYYKPPYTKSPCMSFAFKAKSITKIKVPAIVHIDNTSRIQTLNNRDNPILHKIIDELGKKTCTPIIMNSSFNFNGHPIVDTPDDAKRSFKESKADVLYINGKRYEKKDIK